MTGNGAGDAASDLFGLAGQVAVVTGGSRGIGRAIAAGFAEAGADVVIASRKLGNCVAAAAEISASTGRTALPAEFHAGRWADCDRLIEVVYREFGRCDVLVNNAGMSPLYEDLASVTEEYYGTAEQKERFLVPLVNGERRICFSMTERAAGSDATGMRTTAVRDGENWILNGEKWFSSSASISDYALVMARTDADAPRHRQFTTFLVELPDPGYQIIRDIPTLHEAVGTSPGGHAEVRIRDLRVPHANVIGEVGGGFAMGQHRLGIPAIRRWLHTL